MKTYNVVIERIEYYTIEAKDEEQAEHMASELGTCKADWIETNTRECAEVKHEQNSER